jgi:carboxypeptidase Taq
VDDAERFERLLAALREVADLEAASALLDWDEQTVMPPGAAEVRGAQGATVSRLAHERFTRPEVGEWLEALAGFEAAHEPDSFEASLVRVARREYGKAVRVPSELVHALSQATSRAFHAWVEARRADAFGDFRPHLERVLELVREKADHLGWQGERYDALLDIYEPGYTAADVAELFAELHAGLRPLLDRIRAAGDGGDGEPLRGDYPEPAQEALGHRVLEAMGFDFRRGRLDRSAHPFTTSIGAPDDVRVTSRYEPADFAPALYAAIHEGGHGLYEQGIPQALRGTLLGTGASLGVHESQSRLWENLVGRSRGFCTFLLPLLREAFPGQLSGLDAAGLYRAVNRVRPSCIRVEADEVTYNLHIMLRFELERALVRGDLPPADLPAAWNEAMERYVGIRPPGDPDGVLQDVHWSHGLFGYFPTYTLGNLLSAALWQRAGTELGDPEAAFAAGNFAPLLGWLRGQVHALGATLTPKDLVRRVTGGPLQSSPFLAYLEKKYTALYGV